MEITYSCTTAVNLSYATEDGTAKQSGDYTSVSSMVNGITNGDTVTARIPINDDPDQEGDEHFFLRINEEPYKITIEANDPPADCSTMTARIDASEADTGAAGTITGANYLEGGETTWTFTARSEGPLATRCVGSRATLEYRVGIAGDGATFGTDYTAEVDGGAVSGQTGTLVFTSSVLSHTVTIKTLAETPHVREPLESTTLQLSSPHLLNISGASGYRSSPDRLEFVVGIQDASPTPVLSTNPGASHNVSENVGNADHAITLAADPPIIADVSIRCRASDIGAATAGVDFAEVDETLTFMPGDFAGGATTVTKTCSVPIVDDDLDENQEQVGMQFTDVTGDATLTTSSSFNMAIVDDDSPPVASVAVAAATVSEGTATYEIAIDLSQATGKPDVALGYRLSGTAMPGYGETRTAGSSEDYTVSYSRMATPGGSPAGTVRGTEDYFGNDHADGTGQITFVRGETSKTFTVHVHDDSLKELSETIVFELLQDPDETTNTALTNSTSLSDLTVDATDRTTALTVLSDETGIVTLTAPASAREGEDAKFQATLNLDEALPSGVFGSFDVTVGAAGDTASNADFGGWPAAPATTTVFVGDGGPLDIAIPIEADNLPEPDETLTVTLAETADPSRHSATASALLVDDGDSGLVELASGIRAVEGGEAVFEMTLDPVVASGETFDVTYGAPGDTAQANADYRVPSASQVTLEAGTPRTLSVPIVEDDLKELDETFTIVLTGRGSPGGTSATVELQATILADEDSVTLKLREPDETEFTDRLRVREGGGPGEEGNVAVDFRVELSLDGPPSGRSGTIDLTVTPGTAGENEDYAPPAPGSSPLAFAEGTPAEFMIEVLDDEDSESAEYFTVLLEGSADIPFAREFRVHIDDNDGPDPILREIGRHVVARTEALIGNQPRLIPMLRNPGPKASEYSLRLTDGGVDAAEGGFRGETLWGATTLSRAVDGHGEHEHLLATLGAHARMSERLHLGGMLQFDRSETKPGGEVVSGEIRGAGWMAGPYFAMRDASHPLYFEGRLLYGRASNEVDALVIGRGADPRSASFDSERWLAQARVEGTYRFESGATLIPLADFSHARDVMEAFREDGAPDDPIDGQIFALSKLQIGAELEIPVETARGDLLLRPGLRFVASDASGGAWALEEDGRLGLRSRGRIDFGIDYRLEDGFVLGFESFYSGLGRNELESYGAGLDLRLEF